AHRREVRTGVRLAEPDAEVGLAARDAGDDPRGKCRPRIADQQGSALAIGSPVRGDRRAAGQQLLEHHVTLQLRALVASEAARPRHADPAALAELATERRIGGAPVARTRSGRVARTRL